MGVGRSRRLKQPADESKTDNEKSEHEVRIEPEGIQGAIIDAEGGGRKKASGAKHPLLLVLLLLLLAVFQVSLIGGRCGDASPTDLIPFVSILVKSITRIGSNRSKFEVDSSSANENSRAER